MEIYQIALLTLHLIIGFTGFVFWWTRDYEYTTAEIPVSIMVSCSGIFTWILGYFLHGKSKTIFKKRK